MRLVVTGATGQLGSELARSLATLGEVIAFDRAGCDLARPQRVREAMREARPDIIVNAAAYTAVDRAETEEDLATALNGTAVAALADEAQRLGALLVHYSTDYVFDGTKAAPYVESDAPCPLNAYGRSKLAGEQAIVARGGDYLVLRTSWLYAARGQNFVNTILRLARERESLSVVDDQRGAPTWARDLAGATARILQQAESERRGRSFVSGIYHVTAGGAATWHDFARAIIEQYRALHPAERLQAREIKPISSAAFAAPAMRPKNSRLDGSALKTRFGIVLPQWDAALRLCLQELPHD